MGGCGHIYVCTWCRKKSEISVWCGHVCSGSVSLGLKLCLNFGCHPQFLILMWKTLLPELSPESLKYMLLKYVPSFQT